MERESRVNDALGLALSVANPITPALVTVQGRFSLRTQEGRPINVVREAGRLVAFLALGGHMIPRALVAGTLWGEVSESHAHSSLRSALARLPRPARSVLLVSHLEIGLAPGVGVDVLESRALAHRLLEPDCRLGDHDLSAESVQMLSTDLLPGWYEAWVVFESEAWRQLRMHALEVLADRLAAVGRFGDATSAALAAISADPLRESGHAALIRVHLGEGNQSEALREFARYRTLLKAEIGLEPTAKLRGLVDLSPLVVTES